jgi:hypothetical protein
MGNCFTKITSIPDISKFEHISISCIEHWNENVYDLFFYGGVYEENISEDFIEEVYNYYHDNEYHNHNHVFEVLQLGVYLLSCNKKTLPGITQLERLTFCIALLCHDIDHRGYTNNEIEDNEIYLEEESLSDDDKSSIASSNASFNERHHLYITQKLLKKHHVSYDKSLLIRLILFTDLSMHKKFIEMNSIYHEYYGMKVKNDAILILFVKLADIGHILRPLKNHLNNVVKLNAERKIPLTLHDLPRDTIMFNENFVYPLICKIKDINIGLYFKLNKKYQKNMEIWNNILELNNTYKNLNKQ